MKYQSVIYYIDYLEPQNILKWKLNLNYCFLQKTLVVAEGVVRQIDPNLILWEKAQNIIENWLREILILK